MSLLRGICQQCKFYGLVQPKDVVEEGTKIVEKRVCLTCFYTPAGMPSENQTHKRLPEEEYFHV
jgi:hypothetical protein